MIVQEKLLSSFFDHPHFLPAFSFLRYPISGSKYLTIDFPDKVSNFPPVPTVSHKKMLREKN